MKLIERIQDSTSGFIGWLLGDGNSYFVLSNTSDGMSQRFNCKEQPVDCCFFSTIDGQQVAGNYVTEVII